MVEVKPIDVSFSSEDPAFPALNLVEGARKSSDERKQWLCFSQDEKFAHVILTYEKPFVISSLEIKNNGSAYVQVEGGKSDEPGRYKVLWRTQSLMTPSESRTSTETEGIYIFLQQDLPTSEKDKMWDVLKITCSQPFNRLKKYGLSHVVARSALPVKEENPSSPVDCAAHVPDIKWEHDSDAPGVSSVPASQEADKTTDYQTNMIGEVSSSGCSETVGPAASPIKQESSSSDLFYSSCGRTSISSPSYAHASGAPSNQQNELKSPQIKRENSLHVSVDNASVEDDASSRSPVSSNVSKDSSSNTISSLKRRQSESEALSDSDSDDVQVIKRPAPSRIIYKPFNKLLEGVKFVISGFPNPYRAEIRSRALQMGASYSPYWSENCTHLICAFLFTPKYHQARGDGLIVTREWIDQCYFQRKRLPWRRYALNPSDRSDSYAEVEVWELQPDAATSSGSSNTQPASNNSEREVGFLSTSVICSSQPQSQSESSSSSAPTTQVKRETQDSGECASNQRNLQEAAAIPGVAAPNFSTSPVISIKRETTNEAQAFWQNNEDCQQTHSPSYSGSPARHSIGGTEEGESRRLQVSSLPQPQSHSSPISSVPPLVRCAARVEHEIEPGPDGYAGYYRPISQPHSASPATYLVPPVIMLPQSLPQYFVPVSQPFQSSQSPRDSNMGRTTPSSQVHGQHIRVIQPPCKTLNDTESPK